MTGKSSETTRDDASGEASIALVSPIIRGDRQATAGSYRASVP